MRFILYIVFIFLSACSKLDKSAIESPEFKDLVGTWTTDYPNDELRRIKVHQNGKVEIIKSTERGKTYKLYDIEYKQNASTYYGDTLDVIKLISKPKGKYNDSYFITFYKELNSDSAYLAFGFYIKNFEIDTSYPFIKAIFHKKT